MPALKKIMLHFKFKTPIFGVSILLILSLFTACAEKDSSVSEAEVTSVAMQNDAAPTSNPITEIASDDAVVEETDNSPDVPSI